MSAFVVSVSTSPRYTFSKQQQESIRLIAGLGAVGDAHAGTTVRHRSRMRADPDQPNLRQVHLIHSELLDELRGDGYDIAPGRFGENITTRGVDLLGLPTGSTLQLGAEALVRVTGLRNPCAQINNLGRGVLSKVLLRGDDGSVVRKAGVMGVVLADEVIYPGDPITVELPDPPYVPLDRV